MSTELIGKRLRALRESKSISQDAVAELLGIKDRQTISAIETGQRRMSVDELLIAAEKLDVPVGYFTDPFRLEGEAQFSWRSSGAGLTEIQEWEGRVGSWIALYRELTKQLNEERPLFRHALSLSRQSSIDDAITAGERFASEFALGDNPAKRISRFIETRLHFLVLFVDMGLNISGAACRVSDLDVVLISRNEIPGRRNFTLAHELFHLLTWDSMPPKYVEDLGQNRKTRVQALADNFAAALLMPSDELQRYGRWNDSSIAQLINKLNSTATALGVASQELKSRLVNLGSVNRKVADAIPNRALWNNGGEIVGMEEPPQFSKPFMTVVGEAINKGHISVRRTAKLMHTTVDDLQDLFDSHDVDCMIGL